MARAPKEKVTSTATEVRAVMLSRFECIQFPPDEAKEMVLSLNIAVTRASPGNEDGLYFSQVICNCQRVGKDDVSEAHFVALYNVLYRSQVAGEDRVTEQSKQAVSAAAWFNFQNLFALTNAQMKSRMPELPSAPRTVAVRTADQLNDAFNYFGVEEVEAESPE